MPKQMLNIPSFKGGLNTALDPRDIKPSELSKANNVMFDINGIIRCQGKSTAKDLLEVTLESISHGWGLFTYQSNHGVGGVTPASALSGDYQFSELISYEAVDDETGGYWYAISDAEGNIYIKEYSEDSWSTTIDTVDITPSEVIDSKTIYHIADEGLRISNANIASNYYYKNTWFGYIKKTNFFVNPSIYADYHFNGWYALDNDIKKPTDLNFISGDSAITSNNPTAGAGFAVKIAASTGGSLDFTDEMTGEELKYDIAATFIYDGIQESLMLENTSNIVLKNDTTDNVTNETALIVSVCARTGYNPRITGGRIYYKKYLSNDDYVLLCDIDFENGVRASLDKPYPETPWETTDANSTTKVVTSNTSNLFIKNLDTYSSLTEWGEKEKRISIGCTGTNYPSSKSEGYQCSAIVNRRAFIANCKLYNNETSGIASGDTKVEKDRIYYSGMCTRNGVTFESAFDCLPRSNYIDVIKGDAEEYTALVGYADRLLAFKNSTLFLINVAGAPNEWFLESQHSNMGVFRPCQIISSEDGVMWANKNGAYIYTGGEVRTTTTEDISFGSDISNFSREKINKTQWFTEDSGMSVGYVPKYSQFFVINTTANGNSSIAYIYDNKTTTWSSSSNNMIIPQEGINGEITNFITDKVTGNIMWGSRADYEGSTELVVNGEFDQDVDDDISGYDNDDGTVNGYQIYDANDEAVPANTSTAYLEVHSQGWGNELILIAASNTATYYFEYTIPGDLVLNRTYILSVSGYDANDQTNTQTHIVYPNDYNGGSDVLLDASDWLSYTNWVIDEHPVMEVSFTAQAGSHKIRFSSIPVGGAAFRFRVVSFSVAEPQVEDGNLKFYEFKNDNLIIGADNFNKFNVPANTIDIRTKDMDFGQTGLKKRVYAVYITYRSNAAQTKPVSYAIDGASAYNTNAENWTNLEGNMIDTSQEWKVEKFYPSTTFTCQSLRLQIKNPSEGIIEINDISIEHRITGRKVA